MSLTISKTIRTEMANIQIVPLVCLAPYSSLKYFFREKTIFSFETFFRNCSNCVLQNFSCVSRKSSQNMMILLSFLFSFFFFFAKHDLIIKSFSRLNHPFYNLLSSSREDHFHKGSFSFLLQRSRIFFFFANATRFSQLSYFFF